VSIFLNPPDEIIDDSPDDDQFIEQLAQSYAKGPEVGPDAADVLVPAPISIPQALGAPLFDTLTKLGNPTAGSLSRSPSPGATTVNPGNLTVGGSTTANIKFFMPPDRPP